MGSRDCEKVKDRKQEREREGSHEREKTMCAIEVRGKKGGGWERNWTHC